MKYKMINNPLSNKDQQKKLNNKKNITQKKGKILNINLPKLASPRKGIKRFSILPEDIKRRKDLSPGAKYIYSDLIKYAGKNDNAFPKRATIAESCGMHIRLVDKHIKELKEKGLIQVERRGLRRSNKYFFIEQDWQREANPPPPEIQENKEVECTLECRNPVTPIVIDNLNKIHIAGKEPEPKTPPVAKSVQQDIVKKMIDIWEKVVEEGKTKIQTENLGRLRAFLIQALKDRFESCLEKWKDYCEKVASSLYLMGEKKIFTGGRPLWRATLDWCLRFANIDKILSGKCYNLGDRAKKEPPVDANKVEMEVKKQIAQSEESGRIKEFKANLLKECGAVTYSAWLKKCQFEETTGGGIDIKTPTRFFQTWVLANLEREIAIASIGIFQYASIGGKKLTNWERERQRRAWLSQQEQSEQGKIGVREAISSFLSLCKSEGVGETT